MNGSFVNLKYGNHSPRFGQMVLCILSLFLITHAATSWSQVVEDESLNVIYRDTSGEWSDQSKVVARQLLRKARTDGAITLWVTLNFPFQTTFDQMTQREIDAQNRSVNRELRNLLGPLVRSGVIHHPSGRLKVTANGCKVVATADGVKALVSDKRVLHMVEIISRT